MRTTKWLLAAGLVAATAACTTDGGYYPNTAYNSGYNSNGYYYPTSSSYNRGYYSNSSSYYAPSSSYSSGYYQANRTPRRGPNGDYDRDGIPNKYDRDANGDGVPDRYQR